MNVNIVLQGQHILFEREEAMLDGSTIGLLADIPAPISIEPGKTARIATPIALQGDGRTIALIEVHAGRNPRPEGSALYGAFMIPPEEDQETVVVEVINDTAASLMIHPKVRLGVLSFQSIAQASDIANEPVSHDENLIAVKAVYKPSHIDQSVAPAYATEGAAAFDLRADLESPLTLAPGEQAMIATGLRMAIPQGFEGQVRPRSGLAAKHSISITNSPGTIDADYTGEVKVLAINLGKESYTIEPSERIAQMLIAPVMKAIFEFTTDLDETARGQGGFGSTGR